ncbi:acyl-CoA carboxylase subunit epsilon (plasmid) [Streptomyces sp. HUAS MG91]|uniref:Acyl-CoA carboxylase subunit epsilon n=1 Tax=Streptomyces tabacisoli TaxID=3156398 RepID=A0AAU8J6Q8_9ACTN
MGDANHGMLGIRVERGRASDEELAVLTVVLLTLRARARAERAEGRPRPRRRRLRLDDYQAPHSWR